MLLNRIDEYIEKQPVETAQILVQLGKIILSTHPKMTETWKYNCPFYLYQGLFCYLAIDKSAKCVYIGFCDGHLMSNETKNLLGTEKKLVRKFYVYNALSQREIQTLNLLLQEAVIIKETLQPKFTPPKHKKLGN
jgi:hypothetical protein